MNLPPLIDNAALAKLAAPDEKVAIRVIVRQVFNNKPYRLRGRIRHYLADHNPTLNVHVLDVPASVWMKDFPTTTYKENPSIAHDLQGNRLGAGMSPLLFAVIPWKTADASTPELESPAPAAGLLVALQKLAESLGAPELLVSAIKLVATPGKTAGEIEDALLKTTESVEAELRKADGAAADLQGSTEAGNSNGEAVASEVFPTARSAMSNAERQKAYRERKAAEKEAAKKAATKSAKKREPAKA